MLVAMKSSNYPLATVALPKLYEQGSSPVESNNWTLQRRYPEGVRLFLPTFFGKLFSRFYPLLTKVNLDSTTIWHVPPNCHRWGMVHVCYLWHLLLGFVAAPYILMVTIKFFLDRKNFLICEKDVSIFLPLESLQKGSTVSSMNLAYPRSLCLVNAASICNEF